MITITEKNELDYKTEKKNKGNAWVKEIVSFIEKNADKIKKILSENENRGVVLTVADDFKDLKEKHIAGGSGTVNKADELLTDFSLKTHHELRKNKNNEDVNKAVGIIVKLSA